MEQKNNHFKSGSTSPKKTPGIPCKVNFVAFKTESEDEYGSGPTGDQSNPLRGGQFPKRSIRKELSEDSLSFGPMGARGRYLNVEEDET
jgi:hypothetical protein